VTQSQTIRQLLPGVPIVASGDLDEYRIAELKVAGAVIDGFGCGTKLVTGEPVNGVYKLVEIDGIPVMKEAAGKITYPGRKQIFRTLENGQIQADRLGLATETARPNEQALLQRVMQAGQRCQPLQTLETIADRTARSVASLPLASRSITRSQPLTPTLSDRLQQLTASTRRVPVPTT
jgi:nicotinate phosphoribosyltransferase